MVGLRLNLPPIRRLACAAPPALVLQVRTEYPELAPEAVAGAVDRAYDRALALGFNAPESRQAIAGVLARDWLDAGRERTAAERQRTGRAGVGRGV